MVDTFSRYFEPEIARAAVTVLTAGGYQVHLPVPIDGSRRPLCCGRTFLSIGHVEAAKQEARRTLDALAPFIARGVPVVGLEPSCLLSFRDEVPAILATADAKRLAGQSFLIEEFLAAETAAGRLKLDLGPISGTALLHGHCHQKAFGAFSAVEKVLRYVPRLDVQVVETSCCGMAGSFGYQAETVATSRAMAELALLPAVRRSNRDTLIVADGTSCRHQIRDGTGRRPLHVVEVLARSLAV